MGRTKIPISIHFHVESCPVTGFGHSVPFITRLKKEYSYTSIAFLSNCDLFYFEPCILPARRVRRSLLQYIMCRTAVVVIAVLTADSSGRTVLR